MTTDAAAVLDSLKFPRRALERPAARRRFAASGAFIGDALSLLAVAFAVPFIVLAVGMPIVLTLRLLLWLVGSL